MMMIDDDDSHLISLMIYSTVFIVFFLLFFCVFDLIFTNYSWVITNSLIISVTYFILVIKIRNKKRKRKIERILNEMENEKFQNEYIEKC